MKKRKFITAVFTVLIPAMLACMPASCQNAAKNTAVLILSDTREITITAETEDGSAITVEGCTETALASSWDWDRGRDNKTVLHARGEKVVLKGKIIKLDCSGNNLTELNVQGLPLQWLLCGGNQLTELDVQGLTSLQGLYCGGNQLTELNVKGCASLQELWCGFNQLTELNVQGCTSLQTLFCGGNQFNKEAFTKLFTNLPDRNNKEEGNYYLYTEETGKTEGNCKDFTEEELKVINNKNWIPKKVNQASNWWDEI